MAKEISTTFTIDVANTTVLVHEPKTGSFSKQHSGTTGKRPRAGSDAKPKMGSIKDDHDGPMSRDKKGTIS